jgi:hypothetical protein
VGRHRVRPELRRAADDGRGAGRPLRAAPDIRRRVGIVHAGVGWLFEVRPVARPRVYQLQTKPFEELDSWLETFSRICDTRLDGLDEYLHELQAVIGVQIHMEQHEHYL